MSFIKYFKERWIMYLFLFSFCLFCCVYKLDNSFNITESNATYIISVDHTFIAFVVIDYGAFYARIKSFKKYCSLNASSQDVDEFPTLWIGNTLGWFMIW